MRKLTFEEVRNYIQTKSNNECILLSEDYKNNSSKLLIKCACGDSFEASLSNFKAGKMKCSKCSRKVAGEKRKYSYDYIKNFIEINSDSGCKLLSEKYNGVNEKLLIQCGCGNTFKTTWGKFKDRNKRQCNECSYKNCGLTNSLTYEEVKLLVEAEGDCKLLSEEYVDTTTILLFECKCKNTFKTTLNRFKSGDKRQCNECGIEKRASKNRKTNETFLKEVYYLILDEYDFLEEYNGADTKIKCKHNICDHEYYVRPSDFLNGKRCPQCSESKGERIIREYLKGKNIKFQQEYSFINLIGIGGKPLRFDFAIFDTNIELILLIEYDGEFHFNQQYKTDGFENLQMHDKRKDKYCSNKNIPLLRIPYWEYDNIEQILIKNIPIAI